MKVVALFVMSVDGRFVTKGGETKMKKTTKKKQVPLKTLGKTTWEDIEIGEVFAINGCWEVAVKLSEKIYLRLADDWFDNDYSFYSHFNYFDFMLEHDNIMYKLPKSVQRLWYEQ